MPGMNRFPPRIRTRARVAILGLALLSGSLVAIPPAVAFSSDPLVSAWLPAWAGSTGEQSFRDHVDAIDELCLFWYALGDDGSLTVDPGAEDLQLLAFARARGVRVYMTVRNGFIGQRFHDMVSDPTKRAQHIQDLLAKMDTVGFDGIDIDYEGLFLEDRDAFTSFMTDLAREVHLRNKLLSVAIQAKTSEPGEWASLKAQEWRPVGAVVDRFRVMTYDKHYSGSGPGAVSPLPWLLEVERFAVTQVAPEKVQMGLPFYGYAWPRGRRGTSITWQRAQELIAEFNVPVAYDETNKAPFFAYEREEPATEPGGTPQKVWRDAWFENARSIQDKVNALRDRTSGGVAVWRLGEEDPGAFPALASVRNRAWTEPFTDVADDSLAAEGIRDLRARGVVQGENGRFDPGRHVTRAEAVKIALGHMRFPTIATDPEAPDVPRSSWAAPYIATAKARALVQGGLDGLFRPDMPMTRTEALKLILRARHIAEGGTHPLPPDVSAEGWSAPYIRRAMELGIVKGDTDGRFRPDDSVTRAEFVALLTRPAQG